MSRVLLVGAVIASAACSGTSRSGESDQPPKSTSVASPSAPATPKGGDVKVASKTVKSAKGGKVVEQGKPGTAAPSPGAVQAAGKQEIGASASPASVNPALLDPAQATGQAPDEFAVKLQTTKGDFFIDVKRAWAPLGADRFYNLVRIGYFDDTAFFRVVENFMAQVGIHGDPRVNAVWRRQSIKDDPATQSNLRGLVSFATSGKDSRVNQFFINFVDNSRLDSMGFAPFGKVRNMDVVDRLYSGYGESAPAGRGPAQRLVQTRGNAYLHAEFPEMDYIQRATIVD